MTKPAIFHADYVDIRQVKSRKVYQIVLEIPKEAANAFTAAFGMPESDKQIPVAIARLVEETQPPTPAKIPKAWEDHPFSAQAAMRSTSEDYWRFLTWKTGSGCEDSERATYLIKQLCQVGSRREFNGDAEAAERWCKLDADFYAWQRDARAQA